VELLLENSVDVNAKGRMVETALHWAAGERRGAEEKLLLEHGADVTAKDWGRRCTGRP